MRAARRKALAKLEAIGGEVSEEEVAFHLGEATVLDLYEAESEGLVISRTTFEVTDQGRQELKKTGSSKRLQKAA